MNRRLFTDALHILVLCSFALSQPIYDLVGQNAEFFVAHRLGPAGILAFAAALSVGIPAAIISVEYLAARIRPSLQKWLHIGLMALLFALALAPVLNKLALLPGFLPLVASAIGALALAALYSKSDGFRSFVTVLSPGIIVFPVLFFAFTPVSGLMAPTEEKAATQTAVKNPVPIVFVILDEFEAGALLDEHKQIDAVRFPNFASFSKNALWFPHATTAWPETRRAVPAILTGLLPSDRKAIPSVQSHPDNLFTWLGGAYRFNAAETLTNLCPSNLCATEDDSAFDMGLFVSDLSIVFLHVVLPPAVAKEHLPPMDTGWKGFGAGGVGHDDHSHGGNGKKVSAYRDRGERFQSFIDSIRKEEPNTLNFLHILLPHVGYTYLPSGASYLGGETEGLLDHNLPDKVWTTDDYLPALAYQRFLLQLGFVDRLLGKLVDRLKSEGLYDSSLIIVTSDHGKSFRPGQPKRLLTRENASDLLQIPLFIKLPGQKDGQRDERRVSSVDILPTIAQAIGAELPWATDGQSLLSPSYRGRDIIELNPLDEHRATGRYDARELTAYPRLSWKLETFGSHTPLSGIGIRNRFSDLVGQRTDALKTSGNALLTIVSDQFDAFANVRPEAGVIPAHLHGEIQETGPSNGQVGPVHVAVAINGVIQAVTQTVPWLDRARHLSVMLPETAFRPGSNVVELFRIEDRSGNVTLSRIDTPKRDKLRIDRDEAGQEVLISEAGEIFPVRPDVAQGHLDGVDSQAHALTVAGWAIDAEQKLPAQAIVLFADGKQVYSSRPSLNRPDLVRFFKAPGVLPSGFRFAVGKHELGRGRNIRMFGISNSGKASEVNIGEQAMRALAD